MTKAKTGIEKFADCIEKAREIVTETIHDPSNADRLIKRLTNILYDYRKIYYVDEYTDNLVVIVANHDTGELIKLTEYKAQLARWKMVDEEGYNDYVEKFTDFIHNLDRDSVLVKLFGKDGENVLPVKELG